MIISLIAAMAENRVIGRGTAIPWDLPDDRRRFRELTWGQPIVMGRKTFETLAGPLPGRLNIILTRDRTFRAAGCLVVHEREEVLAAAGDAEELFICGGGEVYREFLPLAERIYLTVLHQEREGEVLFPEIPGDFAVVSRKTVAEPLPHSYIIYEKKP
ncbi:MAG: dihydrofolate reductase [Deltaproteobacteria bacterium]|nr:dihydrofolate reductase [Deltaproteobacteria bacterium]TLN04697.1 MAG: dihydrofolate reductase [bacterium]